MSRENTPELRFLGREMCEHIARRVSELSTGGGSTGVSIISLWSGNLRWARNVVTTSGDIRNNQVNVFRRIRGARGGAQINRVDDSSLLLGVQRAERMLQFYPEDLESELPEEPFHETHAQPKIWSDETYALDAKTRAATMRRLVQPSVDAGMQSAGYLQVAAYGQAAMLRPDRWKYYSYTQAQYSVTVRSPDGTASGWAGVDWHDWKRIDADRLSAIALNKCLRSTNPVRLEPGRYTTILEPQATCDLVANLFTPHTLDRSLAENNRGPYAKAEGLSKIGERIMDGRITVNTDCMDPDLGFPPFSPNGVVYYPVTWVSDGVLTELAYSRQYAIQQLGKNTGQPASGAFRMSGGTTSVEEMIHTTRRGLLVTRFSNMSILDIRSMLMSGYTRDGLWLIENGKITKSVRNFRFTESPLHMLNNVEQLGVPQRVFRPGAPAIVPSLKIRDFGFSGVSDAV